MASAATDARSSLNGTVRATDERAFSCGVSVDRTNSLPQSSAVCRLHLIEPAAVGSFERDGETLMGGMRFGGMRALVDMGWRKSLAVVTRGVGVAGLLVVLLAVALAVGPPVASAEALCTDTWAGPSEASWTTAGDWSSGKVPSSADVACIAAGKTVEVTGGSNQAGVLLDKGTVVLSGGSLELVDTLEASSASSLTLSGGTLTGAATLDVTGTFSASEGHMSGSGSTVLEAAASGTIEVSSESDLLYLEERHFINRGTLTFTSGTLTLSHGAHFENAGTFKQNSQTRYNYCQVCVTASGGASSFTNTGTYEKAAGTGSSRIEGTFINRGTVHDATGTFELKGEDTGEAGTWSASSGSNLSFVGGSTDLHKDTLSGPISVSGSSVAVEAVSGPRAQIDVSTGALNIETGGTTTVESLSLSGGEVTGAGTLEIATSLLWTNSRTSSESVMSGSGKTVLASGGSGTIKEEVVALKGRKLVNEGTIVFENVELDEAEDAVLENKGTFKDNSESGSPQIILSSGTPSFLNRGTFEKTAGTGTAAISVPFINLGTVSVSTGHLLLKGGGESEAGKWTASAGTNIVFSAGSFWVDRGSWSGAVEVAGATVTVEELAAGNSQVTVTSGVLAAEGGPTTVEMLSFSAGEVTGAGTLNISSSLLWTGRPYFPSESNMSGTGATVLEPGASATLEREVLHLEGRKLVNEGTMVFENAEIYESGAAVLENTGTFKDNSELGTPQINRESAEPSIVNMGTFERTAGKESAVVAVNFSNYGTLSHNVVLTRPRSLEGATQYGEENLSYQEPLEECGEGVNCATGNLSESETDFAIGGRGVGLDLTRTYNSQAAAEGILGIFGYGWSNSFGDHLVVEEVLKKTVLHQANGSTVPFTESSGGAFTAPEWSQDLLSGTKEAGYSLTLENQTVYKFAGATGRLESVTDRNGNATTLTYNGSGQLTTITDPASRTIKLAYNTEGLVESAEDPMKHVVKYTYKEKQLASVTQPAETALRWQFAYDGSHQLTELTDGRGNKSTNEYTNHQVTKQIDNLKRETTFEYEPFFTKTKNVATAAVTLEEFTSNDQPNSITHGYGTSLATTETRKYNSAGDLTSVTDGDGHTTKYGYDSHSNRTSMIDPERNETQWTYNSTHDVETETKPNGEKTTYKRESHGNPEIIERPAPGGKTQITKYKYGTHGEVEIMTDPLERTWKYEYDNAGDKTAEADPEGDKRTWGYNEDSQETSTVSPRGHVSGAKESEFTTTTEVDAQGRPIKITDPLGHETKYTYDGDGNIETVTDPEGHKTTNTYDADNERTKVEEPNKTIAETEYDSAGQIKKQIDGNKHATEYTRNVLEQVTEVTDPLGRKTLKEYDKAGNLVSVTDAAKRTTTYKYDADNRLAEIAYSDGKTPTVKYEYNADSDRTKMIDGTGTTTYEYDQLDRLTATKDGHGNTVGYEYDLANEQTKITYPNGKVVEREYDKAGRLKSTTDWSKNVIKFAYDADSDLTATTFPSGTSDEDTYKYDDTDAMTEVKMKKSSEILASLAYTRDKDELVEQATSKGLPGEEKPSYTYDKNNRLTKGVSIPYEYDAANNPTTIGTEHTYSYNAANELEKSVLKKATAAIYTYNEVGERTKTEPTSGPATTYGYDQAGNLISVTRPKGTEVAAIEDTYGYNGDGLRTSETISGTTIYVAWDFSEKLPLILNDGTNSYIYGPEGLAVEQIKNSSGTVLYLHHDQQGSTRLLTGSTGKNEATFTYDAYGNKTGSTGTSATPMGYDGQYSNADTGLSYLRAREYDPVTGQFMSVDPAVATTLAQYSYATDNPINASDPSGLIPWSPKIKASIAKCQSWKQWHSKKSPFYDNKVIYDACQNLLNLPAEVFGTGPHHGPEWESQVRKEKEEECIEVGGLVGGGVGGALAPAPGGGILAAAAGAAFEAGCTVAVRK